MQRVLRGVREPPGCIHASYTMCFSSCNTVHQYIASMLIADISTFIMNGFCQIFFKNQDNLRGQGKPYISHVFLGILWIRDIGQPFVLCLLSTVPEVFYYPKKCIINIIFSAHTLF